LLVRPIRLQISLQTYYRPRCFTASCWSPAFQVWLFRSSANSVSCTAVVCYYTG